MFHWQELSCLKISDADFGTRVLLNATNISALEQVDIEDLKKYSADMLPDKPYVWQ
jgi:uncharacterized protein (DUF2237 family)